MAMSFKQMFPEAEVMANPPALMGRPAMPRSPLNALTREQLSDIAVAFDLDCNRDGTKEEIMPAILQAEASGRFQKPAKDPYRLTKASKNADEWKAWREAGQAMPAFEMPDEERKEADSWQMLRARGKQAGLNIYGKTREEILAMLGEVEGKSAEQ